MATEDVLALLNSSYEGIIAIDEAYVDFSETPSLCYLLQDHPRLIVLQTMSKAFGFAGIRFDLHNILNGILSNNFIRKWTVTGCFTASPPLPLFNSLQLSMTNNLVLINRKQVPFITFLM